MKRRFLCIAIVLVILVMILGVCGRGSSSADSAPADSAPAEDSGIATYNAASETQNDSYSETEVYEIEDTYTVDELVMMIESGELSLDDVYMQVASGEINESEDILYEVENIIAEYEAEKARNASGIVVTKIIVDQIRTWDSTGTFHSKPFTVYLDVINPDTGDVSNFRTFSSMETHSCSLGRNFGSNTSVTRKCFNSDFTKMVATLTMEDGAVHVGWIDESGNFTDISEKVSHSSEFGGLISHECPFFYHDYFYFMDSTEERGQVKRVPIDSLSEASVEVIQDDMVSYQHAFRIYPDGSTGTDGWEFSDESMMYGSPGNIWDDYIFNDWISTTECVGTEHFINDMIYKYVVEGNSKNATHWYEEKIALVPEVKGRDNWNAVVSPEGERIAFLSKLNSGTDHSTSLFIVSINGGEPTKVNTSYDLGNSSGNIVALFDWR